MTEQPVERRRQIRSAERNMQRFEILMELKEIVKKADTYEEFKAAVEDWKAK